MAEQRTKVQELSIFTVGIGVVLAALTLWLSFALRSEPGKERTTLMLVVPLLISAVLILLGVLTSIFKNPLMLTITMVFVVLGFGIDLVIGFNVVKAAIDVLVIALVVNTWRQAMKEVKPKVNPEQSI